MARLTYIAEARALNAMQQRCENPKHKHFSYYGGRGIMIHERYRGRGKVERLVADIGPKPSPLHTIDRIENSKGYEPGNLRWATRKEQAANTRPKRNGLTPEQAAAVRADPRDGETVAKEYGVTRQAIWRIRHGLSHIPKKQK
jgi:hypothetical protein